ncbi:MAG: CARDB domain-containing protein [Pseudomonadota bacterium]
MKAAPVLTPVKQQEKVVAPVRLGPPDIAVTVQFVHVESWTKEDGTRCYSPRPSFTITNMGQSNANNFNYVIEWKLGPGHSWQVYTSSNPTISLGAGATQIIDGNQPTWEQPWCTNEPGWRPGWRIRADTNNAITESNENNNVAEKIFESYMIKPEIPKLIPKGIQPAPSQKRTPIKTN